MTATTPATLPELKGEQAPTFDGRFRTWTAAHLPANRLPHFEPDMRSPAFVALDGWYVTWVADQGWLSAYQCEPGGKHPLHGTRYPNERAAMEAAYNAGLLGLMVYVDVAERYGLPS